jgi:hypothetical protein
MQRFTRTISALAALFALCALGIVDPQDDGKRAPLGIVPAQMTLAKLRSAHAHALGSPLPSSYVEHWTLTQDGMTGSLVVTTRGTDERQDLVLDDTLRTATGTLKGREWEQNATGEISYPQGIHRRNGVDADALRTMGTGVTFLGMLSGATRSYVVRVDPPNGRLEYVYYDASTFLVDRIDQALDGTRDIFLYDDYRNTDGHMVAWHIHAITAKTGIERDRRLQSFDSSTPVTDGAVAIPASSHPLVLATSPAELPVHIFSDRIVVTAHIKGRAVNFLLDSGSSGILIDPGILSALGIPTFGKSAGTMAGNYSLSHAIIPEIDFGSVSLHNAAAAAIPFTWWADEHTPIAGLMGFDLLDAATFKIDYVHGAVTAIDPATFTPPAGAFSQSIALDDNVPVVTAMIANAHGNHFVLDTGADRSTLYSAFVQGNALSGADQGLGTQLRDAFPFETQFAGVGGKVAYRPLQLGPFTFAGETFSNWLFDATYGTSAASFEWEDYDGLIGQDVLRYFDVYLDYPHQRIYFVPNSRYTDRFG